MRVAVCISGQTRSYLKCFKSLCEQVLNRYNCDVFIHTWTKQGNGVVHNSGKRYWDKSYTLKDFQRGLQKDNFTSLDVLEMYKPKKILIQEPEEELFLNKLKDKHYEGFFNVLMMWYGIFHANNLANNYAEENQIKYDFVIRCRFDTEFINFNIKPYLTETIVLPYAKNFGQQFTPEMKEKLELLGDRYMTNDQFAYGEPEPMKYYSKIFMDYCNLDYPSKAEEALSKHLFDYNSFWRVKVDEDIKIQLKS